jgi:ornithine cyclodeaminase
VKTTAARTTGSHAAHAGQVRVYSASEIRDVLTVADLVEPVADAFVAYSRGESETPAAVLYPSAHGPAAGDAHVKSATLRGRPVFTVKVATWFARTAAARSARGEPTGGGLVAVFDAETGDALAVLHDEHLLSDLRTAAAGVVAARALVPDTARVAGVIGTGVQAELQLLALAAVRRVDAVHVWGRDPQRTAALARRLAISLPNATVKKAASPRAVVETTDVIITATASREPLVHGAWLRPGQHVTAVGADDANKCELDAAALRRADRLVVDSRELTLRYGDVHRAVSRGELSADVVATSVVELGEVLDGRAPGRRSAEEVTVAKLIGLGVQDLVAAEVALARLGALGPYAAHSH